MVFTNENGHAGNKDENVIPEVERYDQQRHPEIRSGERWITNTNEGTSWTSYNTARLGITAYDNSGNRVEGLKPMFVSQEEYNSVQATKNRNS